MVMGSNTTKWTNPDPCLVLSESDSFLCTNFDFLEEKNRRHFFVILTYKAMQFMTKQLPRKVHIF